MSRDTSLLSVCVCVCAVILPGAISPMEFSISVSHISDDSHISVSWWNCIFKMWRIFFRTAIAVKSQTNSWQLRMYGKTNPFFFELTLPTNQGTQWMEHIASSISHNSHFSQLRSRIDRNVHVHCSLFHSTLRVQSCIHTIHTYSYIEEEVLNMRTNRIWRRKKCARTPYYIRLATEKFTTNPYENNNNSCILLKAKCVWVNHVYVPTPLTIQPNNAQAHTACFYFFHSISRFAYTRDRDDERSKTERNVPPRQIPCLCIFSK